MVVDPERGVRLSITNMVAIDSTGSTLVTNIVKGSVLPAVSVLVGKAPSL